MFQSNFWVFPKSTIDSLFKPFNDINVIPFLTSSLKITKSRRRKKLKFKQKSEKKKSFNGFFLVIYNKIGNKSFKHARNVSNI